MTTPAVAIGGITPQNCAPLVKAGADFIAAIGSVWDHPQGPGAAVEAFNKAIASVIA
jgi:thiamine-phosphate pyrophosphorylase